MAHCSVCGKSVGCGCNLINGNCHVCYNANLDTPQNTDKRKNTKRVIYKNPDPNLIVGPNTEFDQILKTTGMSKEEKIKRINDILEKAKQDALNQQ